MFIFVGIDFWDLYWYIGDCGGWDLIEDTAFDCLFW